MKTNDLRTYIKETYDLDTIRDIANHGCQGGISGVTYYDECVELYNKFTQDIWDVLDELREILGDNSIMEMLGKLPIMQNVETDTVFKNNLVWIAFEIICQELN